MTKVKQDVNRVSHHSFFSLGVLTAFAIAYLAASTVCDLVLPRLIVTTHYAGDYWPFGFGSVILSCAGYAALRGARDCAKSGATSIRHILTVVGILLEGVIIVGGVLVLIEAYQYDAWASQFAPMGIANSGADIRYWVAAVMLMGCAAGNGVGAVLLLGKD